MLTQYRLVVIKWAHPWRNKGSLVPKDIMGEGHQNCKGTQEQSKVGCYRGFGVTGRHGTFGRVAKERADQTVKNLVFPTKVVMVQRSQK